jgi:hypothetical protein
MSDSTVSDGRDRPALSALGISEGAFRDAVRSLALFNGERDDPEFFLVGLLGLLFPLDAGGTTILFATSLHSSARFMMSELVNSPCCHARPLPLGRIRRF